MCDLVVCFCIVGVTGFEVNFMDDVGQTLLNWASAFGTQEMVSNVLSYRCCYTSVSFITCCHCNISTSTCLIELLC